MHALIVPPLARTLGALDSILSKAEAHFEGQKVDPNVLFGFRMFPDMLPFHRQVQLACDFGARMAARLAGQEPRSFPDTETNFAELHTRIATARAYVQGFGPADFEGAAGRQITLKMRGSEMTMTGEQYLTLYALPQFYFHATMAYTILRHNGVSLGKADYMGAA